MPASRSDSTVAPSARFDSFFPSAPRMRPWCTYSDAREVKGCRAVLAQQRHALEAVAEIDGGVAIAILPLALPHRAFVPRDPQPLEVVDDRLLPARHVPHGRI